MPYRNILIKVVLGFVPLILAACGGGGGGGGGSGGGNDAPNTTAPVQKNVLFVGDPVNQTYAILPTLAPQAGTSLTTNVLDISALRSFGTIQSVLGMAYDAQRDRLYTGNGAQINILEHASTLKGSIKASSVITPQFPRSSSPGGIAQLSYDKQHDTLYASYGDAGVNNLAIFNNVSTLTGSVVPSKIVAMGARNANFFALDLKRSILYFVRDSGADKGGNVQALVGFDKPNPTLRTLRLNSNGLRDGFQSFLNGIAMDAEHDRLYLGLMGMGLLIIDNASLSSSTAAPVADTALDVKLLTPGIVPMTMSGGWGLGLAFDPANDRLYAGFGQNVYIMNQASQASSGASVNLVLISTPNTSVNTFAFP